QINLDPTSERGASRDAVNRPRETLGDSHLISSDPRSRFGLVCDLPCCRGNSNVPFGLPRPAPICQPQHWQATRRFPRIPISVILISCLTSAMWIRPNFVCLHPACRGLIHTSFSNRSFDLAR